MAQWAAPSRLGQPLTLVGQQFVVRQLISAGGTLTFPGSERYTVLGWQLKLASPRIQ